LEALYEDLFGAGANVPGVLGLMRRLAHVAHALTPVAEALDPAGALLDGTGSRQLRGPELQPAR
jgi:hypothetical protein